jgi:hypothetical protein
MLAAGEDGGCGARTLARAQALLHEGRPGERLALAWGCGAGLVADETRAAMARLLKVQSKPPQWGLSPLQMWRG